MFQGIVGNWMENWNADKNVLSKSGDKVDCVIIIEGNRKNS